MSKQQSAYDVGASIGTGIGLAAAAFGAMNNSVDKGIAERFEKYLDAKRYGEAIKEAEQLIGRHKKDGGVYLMRALAFQLNGQPQQAIQDIDSALGMSYGLDNYRDQAYLVRAEAYSKQGKWSAALQDLSSAIKVAPDNGFYWLKRGIATLEVGDTEQALFNINKAIELDPGDANGYYQRARAHLASGNATSAKSDIDRAIKLEDGKPEYYALRGQIVGALGDTDAATSFSQQAKQLQQKIDERAESDRRLQKAIERENAVKQASNNVNVALFAAIASVVAIGIVIFLANAGKGEGVAPCLGLGILIGALIAVAGGHGARTQLKALGIEEGKTPAMIALVIGYLILLFFVLALISIFL